MSTEHERELVTNAQAALNTLTSSGERNGEVISALREATRLVTTAMARSFSGDAALNALRGDAANALSAEAGSLDAGAPTAETIAAAKSAIADLLAALKQQTVEPEKIYADPSQPATLRHPGGLVDCHTLEEAVLAWMRLSEQDRSQAVIKAGSAAYNAAEIDRLHVAPHHVHLD